MFVIIFTGSDVFYIVLQYVYIGMIKQWYFKMSGMCPKVGILRMVIFGYIL